MKKIAIIGRWLNDKDAAGIHRYTLEIVKELDKIVSEGEVELLIPDSETIDFTLTNINIVRLGKNLSFAGTLGKRVEGYLYKNYYSYKYIKRTGAMSVDLLLQFPLYGCDVIAIYDCRVNKFPELYNFTKGQKRIRKATLKHQNRAVKKCSAIITDSSTACGEILDIYGSFDKPINVIYCGWQHFSLIEEDKTIIDRLNLTEGKYYFSLGSRFPHKNIKWINCAAQKHPDEMFVVSGKNMGAYEYEGEQHSNMIFTGRLSDKEIKALMHYCKAFIQPSIYEGFGMPPLEAMSVGADCIISDIPVFREVYKDSVWYFDPYDYENINITSIMSKSKKDSKDILDKYSWEKSARKLYEVLKSLQ